MPNRAKVRQFILDYFSDSELDELVFDYFPDVLNNFTTGMEKRRKVMLLITHAEHHDRYDDLLGALAKTRPSHYQSQFGVTPVSIPESVEGRRPNRVFISHAHQERDIALELADFLGQNRFDVWMAPESIRPGEKWVDAINYGLETSSVFVLILTRNAVGSEWVRDEVSYAIERQNKREAKLIILQAEETPVPPLWGVRQYIDIIVDIHQGFARLLQELIQSERGEQSSVANSPRSSTSKTPGDEFPAFDDQVLPESGQIASLSHEINQVLQTYLPEAKVTLEPLFLKYYVSTSRDEQTELTLRILRNLSRHSDDALVRRTSVEALGALGEAAIPILSELAQEDRDAMVRLHAAKALGALGEPTVPILVELAQHGEDSKVRLGAAEALASLGENDLTREALNDFIQHASDYPDRLRAEKWLQALAYQATAVDPNSNLLRHSERVEPRLQAAEALGAVGAPAQEILSQLAHKSKDAKARMQAASTSLSLARYFLNQKQYDEAEQLFRMSLDVFEQSSSKPIVAVTQSSLAFALLEQGKYEEAEQQLLPALEVAGQIGNKQLIAFTQMLLAMSFMGQKEPHSALAYLGQSRSGFEALKMEEDVALVDLLLLKLDPEGGLLDLLRLVQLIKVALTGDDSASQQAWERCSQLIGSSDPRIAELGTALMRILPASQPEAALRDIDAEMRETLLVLFQED